jgi:hypothetical protein
VVYRRKKTVSKGSHILPEYPSFPPVSPPWDVLPVCGQRAPKFISSVYHDPYMLITRAVCIRLREGKLISIQQSSIRIVDIRQNIALSIEVCHVVRCECEITAKFISIRFGGTSELPRIHQAYGRWHAIQTVQRDYPPAHRARCPGDAANDGMTNAASFAGRDRRQWANHASRRTRACRRARRRKGRALRVPSAALTASVRGGSNHMRVGTKKRFSDRTKKLTSIAVYQKKNPRARVTKCQRVRGFGPAAGGTK